MKRQPTTPPRPVDMGGLRPEEVAATMSHLEGFIFLDSASAEPGSLRPHGRNPPRGEVSLLAAFPTRILKGNLSEPGDLRDALNRERPCDQADWGVPLGGAFGFVAFDGSYTLGIYERLLFFSHSQEQWYEVGDFLSDIEATVSPARISHQMSSRGAGSAGGSKARADFPVGLGEHTLSKGKSSATPLPPAMTSRSRQAGENCGPASKSPVRALEIDFPIEREDFCRMVDRAQEYIAAGDIYQVNLSHGATAPWPDRDDAFPLYRQLRDVSPTPFAAFVNLDGHRILSSSPELFLKISGACITTRPIKGTRPRFSDPNLDEKSAYDLITSPKEVAELVMITDLERNDLGMVSRYGSVDVTDLLKLERFAQVFHLVSTIQGTLRPGCDHLEALRTCFPGGSISGAPKKRALEIIQELEPDKRGLYTGAIGYLGFNGESQFNIAIRTAVIHEGEIRFQVGAGIVADSNPDREYEETLHKAAGFLAAVERHNALIAAPIEIED